MCLVYTMRNTLVYTLVQFKCMSFQFSDLSVFVNRYSTAHTSCPNGENKMVWVLFIVRDLGHLVLRGSSCLPYSTVILRAK